MKSVYKFRNSRKGKKEGKKRVQKCENLEKSFFGEIKTFSITFQVSSFDEIYNHR